MTSTRSRRAVATTAIAVSALGGVAFVGTASASAHPHRHGARIHTHLSVHALRRTTYNGKADAIFGHLSGAGHRVVSANVKLEDKLVGTTGWSVLATHKTGKHGNVFFGVTPSQSTHYRLVYGGNANFRPSHSRTVTVGVRDDSLTLDASAKSVDPATSVTLTAKLASSGPSVEGQTIDFRARAVGAKHSHYIGKAMTDSTGTATFAVTPKRDTYYRARLHKTSTLNGAYSRKIRVAVRRSSSLSIRETVNRKGNDVITGTLLGAGHALAGRKVTLLEEPSGSTTFTVVRSKKTVKHGFYRFGVKGSSNSYEVSYAGGPNYEGSTSPVATA